MKGKADFKPAAEMFGFWNIHSSPCNDCGTPGLYLEALLGDENFTRWKDIGLSTTFAWKCKVTWAAGWGTQFPASLAPEQIYLVVILISP